MGLERGATLRGARGGRPAIPVAAIALLAQMLLLAALAESAGLSGAGWLGGLACAAVVDAAVAHGLIRYRCDGLRPADRVTFARVTLVVGAAAVVAESIEQAVPVAALVTLAALALALDAIDGWVARRTRTAAAFGARFDGEVDALLILVLSVYVAQSAGAWVLAIGAARYAFLLAGWVLPWLRSPVPPRYWRKVVAATAGIVLAVAAANVLPLSLSRAALVVVLALLGESFGRDGWWLWRQRETDRGAPAPPPRRARVRRAVSPVLTVLALLVVWAALVAPDRPSDHFKAALLRIPLEGLVLIGLAVSLPRAPRRVLAAGTGFLLAVVVVLKAANYEIFKSFDRPLDPLGDTSQLKNGIETLRLSVGPTAATVIEVAVVAGVVGGIVLLPLAMLRLTRLAADHRRWALRTVAGLGVLSALSWGLDAQLVSRIPVASVASAGILVEQVQAVKADLNDHAVFAKQIDRDAFRNVPTDRLLTGLRGKDVLLVFVEAYGQVAVQGSSFSGEVDAGLRQGNERLASAGFAPAAAFSPPRRSGASRGWRTPASSPGCGSRVRSATTS